MLGAVISMQLAWDTADLFQALMVVINVPVILILSRPALAALKDYAAQGREGACVQGILDRPEGKNGFLELSACKTLCSPPVPCSDPAARGGFSCAGRGFTLDGRYGILLPDIMHVFRRCIACKTDAIRAACWW